MSEQELSVDPQRLGAPRFFQSLADQLWAVQSPLVLRELAQIAQRQGDLEAVQRRQGQRAEDAYRVQIRDGVAIVPVTGPIFPRANLFTMVSGATSLSTLALDLQRMTERADVQAVLLDIDSPGGAVTGVDEMAGIIAEIAQRKPVTAYVGGTGASAAYWLASAASEIVVARTAQVGSIGVVATLAKQQAPDEQGLVSFEIVSSQAPEKRPDPETSEGVESVRERIDPVERMFIDAVATNRNVSRETVIEKFGRGNVVVGEEAVRRGMADRTGTLEGVLTELQGRGSRGISTEQANEGGVMPDHETKQTTEQVPSASEQAKTQPAPSASERQAADPAEIAELCNHAGVPELAAGLIREGATLERARERVNAVGTMRERCELVVSAGLVPREAADALRQAALQAGKGPDGLSADLLQAALEHQSADAAVQSRITPDAQTEDAARGWDYAAKKVADQIHG
ncbi:MAG: S49 family peptidase [Halorhodospira sp.]